MKVSLLQGEKRCSTTTLNVLHRLRLRYWVRLFVSLKVSPTWVRRGGVGGERGLRSLKSANGGARIPCPPTAPRSPLTVTAAKVSRPEYEEVHATVNDSAKR